MLLWYGGGCDIRAWASQEHEFIGCCRHSEFTYLLPFVFIPTGETKGLSMGKAVTGLGWVLLVAGGGLILLGMAGIAMTDGLWAALQTESPFNIANFVMKVITLAPGILLITWGQKLSEKQTRQTKRT
jgi:hypothetical protein